MKKVKRLSLLSLFGILTLASCTKPGASGSVKPSEAPNQPSEKTSASAEKAPHFLANQFSYLIGTYYAKGNELSITKDKLERTGKETLTLVPTKLSTVTRNYPLAEGEEKEKTYDTIVVEYGEKFNNGVSYKAYVNFADGQLHLENVKDNTSYEFRPDIKEFAGTYSAYGDSAEYNRYMSFDGHFDSERGVYPETHRRKTTYSGEQDWYIKSYFVRLNGKVYKARQEFDQDQYGYGKNILLSKDSKNYVLNGTSSLDTSNPSYFEDIGGFSNLSLFDGEKTITTSVDTKTKTFTFGEKSGPYKIVHDNSGRHLKVTLDSKDYLRTAGEYFLDIEADGKKTTYPADDISQREGTYNEGSHTFRVSFLEDKEENKKTSVTFDGEEVSFSYVIENKRKSIKFTKDGKTYILSPDKKESSIRLNTNGTISYPINKSAYLSRYQTTFISHSYTSTSSLVIDKDRKFLRNGKKGEASLYYWHGETYPTLRFILESKEYILSPKDTSIGYFTLVSDDQEVSLYSKEVLEKVYGSYSSDYQDSFIFDSEALFINGVSYPYSFTPSYQNQSGTYLFAISIDGKDGVYENNLNGCFFNTTKSYVKNEVFSSIRGTYSAQGKYGVENIKFTSEGKLLLDLRNKNNDGLDKDVDTPYRIRTNGQDKAFIVFSYNNVSIYIYFKDGYVTIAGRNYYDNRIFSAFGTYSDGTDTIYLCNDSVYLNGSRQYGLNRSYDGNKVIYKGYSATFTFDGENNTVELDKSGNKTVLSRKLTYKDRDKFFGTYTVNEKEVVFKSDGYISYTLTCGGTPVSTYYVTTYNGNLALTFVDLSGTYYLRLDESTGKVTSAFVASSLPPLPPAPPLP